MSTKQLRNIVLIGLFAIPFIPLVVSQSLLFPFITGKAFYFRIIVEIIFVFSLLLIIKDKEYRPKFSWINIAVTAFILAIGLADIFSANPSKSFWSNYERMEGFIGILHFVALYFALTFTIKSKELWNKLFATSVFVSAIMAGYSFLQLAGKIVINQGGVRVDGTFGNATYLAIYMVFSIFLAVYLLVNSRNKMWKYVLGVVILADLIILYYTATRGAILGIIGGSLITFIVLLIKSEKGDKVRKVALVSVVAIMALIGVFLISRDNSYVRTNPVLSRFASLSISDIKTQGRFYVWPIAWKGFLERPILGWGQESFNFVFNKYYNPAMYGQEPWFDRTHDIVLDWLIAGGIVGFLSYASIIISLLYCLFWKSNLSKEEKAIFLGLVASYIFHNIFVFDQIGSYILFFTILAFIHFSSESNSKDDTPEWLSKLTLSSSEFFNKESIYPIASSLLVIALVSCIYFWNYIPIKQNEAIMKVLQATNNGQVLGVADYKAPLSEFGMGFPEALEHVTGSITQVIQSQTADNQTKQNLFNVADTAFKAQMDRVPNDARYRLFYGVFLSGVGDINDASVQFQEAGKLSPTKQTIQFEIGGALLQLGKKDDALVVFKKAYELDPSYDEAKFLYGISALATGNIDLSNQILSGFDKNKIIFDDRYLSVLSSIGRYADVINIIKQRIASSPTNTQYRLNLAAAYLQAGQRDMAVSTIQEIIVIDPSFKDKGEYYITQIKAGKNP